MKSKPCVFSQFLSVVGFIFSSASVVVMVLAFSNVSTRASNSTPHADPQSFRHIVATCVCDEFGIEAAQALAGHASPSMTAHYASNMDGLAVKVAARIG